MQSITNRYRQLASLGAGSMGTVFRTYDRLTGQSVALKQVALPPDLSPEETERELLTLAHEFRVLAGLRHPHIVSVLDYGFDAVQQPFFTMELLAGAQNILEAGTGRSVAAQVGLLIQALEALAYLHRRGVLHHDLKPANILVAGGRVRLLDFGLAVLSSQQRDDDTFGTLQYLAPEVIDGQPYTPAADLYSLGVIAYELLLGRHPITATTIRSFLHALRTEVPDLSALAEQPALAQVLGQLLAKTPAARPADAQAVIAALRQAVGLPAQEEPGAIRESYLQAAAFVGRERELAQLSAALEQARQGQGSAWLVGGESGVGKSRLLDELRTQALVAGFQVLRGQAVEGGGLPYQLWREPLRLLTLSAEVSALEASVLKPIVPDIATLLERDVPDAPMLNGAENTQRLVRVVIDLLRRQEQPLVLLLEDLHWAEESLLLLKEVVRLLADRPILTIGNYRDEERPHLAQEMPGMHVVPLGRLTAEGISQLSAAMLGESGRQPAVLALLEQETEGNTFFMVEVVRALAEESGRLSDIGHTTLPAQVFTGGVQRLVQRRLQRIPSAQYALLQLAAVLGRQIDTAALHVAAPRTDLDRWLLECAEAQVVEVQGEQWRFAHDKLRAGALAAVSAEQRAALHLRAAKAIEQAYAGNLAPQAGRLAEHYRQAGDVDQERHYARQAGDYAVSTFAHAEAARHYSRVLELTEDERDRFELLLQREEVSEWRGEREAQTADLEALAALAEQLHDDRCRSEVALRRVRQAISIGDFPAAIAKAPQALALAQALGDAAAEVTARLHWGTALYRQNDFPAARAQLNPALELTRSAQLADLEIDCLTYLANITDLEGDYVAGRALYEQTLQLSRALGDRRREAATLNNLAVNTFYAGDRATEASYYAEALRLNRQIGRTDDECLSLLNLGQSAQGQGNYDQAETCYRQALPLARLVQNTFYEYYILNNWASLAHDLGDFPTAQQYLEQVLLQFRGLGVRQSECLTLIFLSNVAVALDQADLAAQQAHTALQLAQATGLAFEQQLAWMTLGRAQFWRGDDAAAGQAFQTALALLAPATESYEALNGLVGLAQVSLAQGRFAQAHTYANQILAWLDTHSPIAVFDLIGIYLTCYRVLAANGDPRAAAALEAGYQVLQSRAATISDPAKRQGYLELVRSNRELAAAWQARFNQR